MKEVIFWLTFIISEEKNNLINIFKMFIIMIHVYKC